MSDGEYDGEASDAELSTALEGASGTWQNPDPLVVAVQDPKRHVFADVDGTWRVYHDGLVLPRETNREEIREFVESLGVDTSVRLDRLSGHAARFDRDLFESDLEAVNGDE
ncbi:MAG: hypothetical protein ACOCUO_00390 [archaeon]